MATWSTDTWYTVLGFCKTSTSKLYQFLRITLTLKSSSSSKSFAGRDSTVGVVQRHHVSVSLLVSVGIYQNFFTQLLTENSRWRSHRQYVCTFRKKLSGREKGRALRFGYRTSN